MTSIDVIVPCYNYARYLRGCVQSVLRQEGVQVRVLIIDDCSPDHTPEVGRALAEEDSRVEYRRHPQNARHIATYNEGFEWAAGDATLLLSADDLLTPGALGRAARALEQHLNVGLICGKQIVIEDRAPPVAEVGGWEAEIVAGADYVARMCQSGSNPVCTPTAVVRTSVLKVVGGYRAHLPHTADLEYWLRVAARSDVAVISVAQAYKRMHGANMQVEFVTHALRDLEQRHAAFESFFRSDGHRLDEADWLEKVASKSLGSQAFWAASRAFDQGDAVQCQGLLALACRLDPALVRGHSWSRLAWKRTFGAPVWQAIRPLVERIRTARASA